MGKAGRELLRGRSGKVYSSRAKAERQGRAIRASRRRRGVSGYSDRRRWL